MNEDPGNFDLGDTSTSDNTGTLHDTDVFTSRSSDVPYPSGGNSHSLLLNGTDTNDYAASNNDVPINASFGQNRTMCGWVKLTTTDGDQVAFNYGAQMTGGKFGIYASNGHWWFWGYSSADFQTSAVTDTDWHHHCISYDGITVHYYFDGSLVGSQARTLSTLWSPVVLGQRDPWDTSQPLFGKLDDIRLYDRVLSEQEINEIANLQSAAIDTHPAQYSKLRTPTFEFSTSGGPVTTTCKVDAGAATPCVSPYTTMSLLDGPHTFTLRSQDGAGNVATDSYSWTIDNVHPNAVITQLGPEISTSSTTNFILTAEEPATFECSLDISSFQSCSDSYTTPELADGEHSLVVIATDAAGNGDGTPTVHTWTVDTSQNDNDGDGILNQVERSAPNDGDANDDGIADANQANVTSIKSLDESNYIVVATDCDANSNVHVATEAADHADNGYSYPGGVISFTATGCAPPQCVSCDNLASLLGNFYLSCCPGDFDTPSRASVTILLYGQTNTWRETVRKYNDSTHLYDTVTGATTEHQVIADQNVLKATYTVDDGSSFDSDGEVNDTIVDPVGIGYAIPGAPNTGLGKRK